MCACEAEREGVLALQQYVALLSSPVNGSQMFQELFFKKRLATSGIQCHLE